MEKSLTGPQVTTIKAILYRLTKVRKDLLQITLIDPPILVMVNQLKGLLELLNLRCLEQ